MPKLDESIIRTLLYFDVFNYPLNKNEIEKHLGCEVSQPQFDQALQMLASASYIKTSNNFYGINGSVSDTSIRIAANQKAVERMPKAVRNAKLISKFPFISAVCLSGTISKGVMDEEADIDYFIITKPQRLWVAKSFLVLYKRIFLGNSRKNFCINYLISEEDLAIKEQNIFTAIETATLIPIKGCEVYNQFIKTNNWVYNYQPNFKVVSATKESTGTSKPWWSKILEFTFKGKLGEKLDLKMMNKVRKKYIQQYKGEFTDQEFELMFRSSRNQSKVHNSNHQMNVLNKYEQSVKDFLSKMETAQ